MLALPCLPPPLPHPHPLLTPHPPHTQDQREGRLLLFPLSPHLPASSMPASTSRLPLSHALLPALLLLLQLALLTPTAYAFTKPAALASRRRLVTPILKAASSSSSSSPTVPPVRHTHPYDNLQQQASLWGGNSHFGERHILHLLAGY